MSSIPLVGRLLLFSLFLFPSSLLYGQIRPPFKIVILSEGQSDRDTTFESTIKEEISVLLGPRFDLDFDLRFTNGDLEELQTLIDAAYEDETVDLIIGANLFTSLLLSNRADYPVPTIAGVVLPKSSVLPALKSEDGVSGVPNFTYLESPFDPSEGLATLYEIYPYEQLAIIGEPLVTSPTLNLGTLMTAVVPSDFELIAAQPDPAQTMAALPEGTDAVYFLPLFNIYEDDQLQILIDSINARKLPSFSLLDKPMVEMGVYGAYGADENLNKLPRRIALAAMKIAEGQSAEDLSVEMPIYTNNLFLNNQTAKRISIYADWDLLARASLLKVGAVYTENYISLRSAIAEGLQENLGYRIAATETEIVQQDVGIATSNYLPQIGASATYALTDDFTAESSFGNIGQSGNLSAGGTLGQLLLNEPAMANIAIEKMRLESTRAAQNETELDVILDVAQAYIAVLQAQAFVDLQNQNIGVTRTNFDIAKIKEEVGTTSSADVYRWESELANNNVDLNQTLVQLQQARFNLNRLLNRPISQEFETIDTPEADSIIQILDSRLFALLENPGDLEVFADFLVQEAFNDLPELQQIDLAQAIQERALRSQKRSFYLPTIGVSAGLDYVIKRFDPVKAPEFIPPPPDDPTWQIGASAQLPIFQGFARNRAVEQGKLGLLQLEDQEADLRNTLEQIVRSNMIATGASFNNVLLTRISSESAQKNFELVQDNYSEGTIGITSLIDAQNAALAAEIAATNAAYQLLADIFALERSTGYYLFLAPPEEAADFFLRFQQYRLTR